jgi:hypothetical protein
MLLPGGRNWQLIYHTGATTPSIMTINIMEFRITIKNATFNITAPNTDCCCAECHYDVCHHAECYYAECRGTILIIGSLKSPYFLQVTVALIAISLLTAITFIGQPYYKKTLIEHFQPSDKFHF